MTQKIVFTKNDDKAHFEQTGCKFISYTNDKNGHIIYNIYNVKDHGITLWGCYVNDNSDHYFTGTVAECKAEIKRLIALTKPAAKTKRFDYLSDAKRFARKKRAEGYRVKLIHHLGIANPYREVEYYKPAPAIIVAITVSPAPVEPKPIIILISDDKSAAPILCNGYGEVWALQNYKPTNEQDIQALKTWCRVKGYEYILINPVGVQNVFDRHCTIDTSRNINLTINPTTQL